MQLPRRGRIGLFLWLAAVVTACGLGSSNDSSSNGWSVILEEGEEGHGPNAYSAARLITGETGLLVVGRREQNPADYTLWFSQDGESWTDDTLEPPDHYTEVTFG